MLREDGVERHTSVINPDAPSAAMESDSSVLEGREIDCKFFDGDESCTCEICMRWRCKPYGYVEDNGPEWQYVIAGDEPSWERDPNLSTTVSVCSECCAERAMCECEEVELKELGITYVPDSDDEWLARLQIAEEDEALVRGLEFTDERILGEDPEGEEVLIQRERETMCFKMGDSDSDAEGC